MKLLPGAVVVTLISFMEVLSVSKAISYKTKQPLDLNQEMIGQGIASIGGSFLQGYTIGGSFSRSAMNLLAGAKTGLSNVFSGIMVALVLLFLTPLFYHLPQAVLSASIILAVVKLIDFHPLVRMLKADPPGGIVSVITFLGTLLAAPSLHLGVLLGVALSVVVYLAGVMKPRIVVIGRHPDGTLRDAAAHGLARSRHIIPLRFDGSLHFANSGTFEMGILSAIDANPGARYLLLCAEGIHKIDASGEWALEQILRQTRGNNLTFILSGMKSQALAPLEKSGLLADLGPRGYYRDTERAIEAIYAELRGGGMECAGALERPDSSR